MTNEMILWLLFKDATQTERASYQVTDADVTKWLSTFFTGV